MYVIAGLGNPGRKYEGTKHNIGFITLDVLAQRNGIKVNRIKHKALVGEGQISGHKVLLVKPQTFMNLSGESIREVMTYYKEPAEHLLVIYDDIDVDMGRLRIRAKGSAGTHNGMRSVIYQLQDDRFPRLRVGINSDSDRRHNMDLADYVLGNFSGEERELMAAAVMRAADAVECILSEGVESAMAKYNGKAGEEGARKEDG